MAYKIERVFSNTGTELTTSEHATSLGGIVNMEFDGRYMWVTCSAGIAIFEWWGEASGEEQSSDTLDELLYAKYDNEKNKKLRLVTFISVNESQVIRSTAIESMQEIGATKIRNVWVKRTNTTTSALSPYWIKKCAGKMYVASGANFSSVFEFNIQTQQLIREIKLQFRENTLVARSNLGVSGGKLWYVDPVFDDTVLQKIYSFDPLTGVTTMADIPVRPTSVRAWIDTGYNGSVYVTNYNNVSVSRFSDVDGTFQATIRTNAHPTHIFTGPDRRIWVSSYGGMVSQIDFDDDGVQHRMSSGAGEHNRAVSLATDPVDGAKVWFVNTDGILARHDLNTHEQLEFVNNPPLKTNTSQVVVRLLEEIMVSKDASMGLEIVNESDKGEPFVYFDENMNKATINAGQKATVLPGEFDKIIIPLTGDFEKIKVFDAPQDWHIVDKKIQSPLGIQITPQIFYQDKNLETRTVKPYLFALREGEPRVSENGEAYIEDVNLPSQQVFTLEFTSSSSFTVTGSKSGKMVDGTTDIPYLQKDSSNRLIVSFNFKSHDRNFDVGEVFTIYPPGELLTFRLEDYLYREVYATINGQAAVTLGPKEYFGDN